MRIRRGEKALNSNGMIYYLSKACKFTPVHFLAIKFSQTTPEPGFLCRAGRHRDDHFLVRFLNLISDQYAPGEKL
jgi:hypothetical protein